MKKHLITLLMLVSALTANADTLKISMLSTDAATDADRLKPMAAYLVNVMSEKGYSTFEIQTDNGNSLDKFISTINSSKTDIAIVSLYPAAALSKKTSMTPIFLARKNGSYYSSSFIFVRADSRIYRLKDIAGKIIALQQKNSSAGDYLVLKTMSDNGLKAFPYNDGQKINPQAVGYFYSVSNDEVSADVYLKKADAGVIISADFNSAVPGLYKGSFRIIGQTPEMPDTFIMINSSLPREKQKSIVDALTSMTTNSSGKNALNFLGIDNIIKVGFDWKTLFNTVK